MLQNARVTVFFASELLIENQQGSKFTPHPSHTHTHTHTQIVVKKSLVMTGYQLLTKNNRNTIIDLNDESYMENQFYFLDCQRIFIQTSIYFRDSQLYSKDTGLFLVACNLILKI